MNEIETFYGLIETTLDALRVFQCCREGKLGRIRRRLYDRERKWIRSGSVFVFNEVESGIKRWTDGRLWSPSRIYGNFLIYRELESRKFKNEPSTNGSNPSSSSTGSILPIRDGPQAALSVHPPMPPAHYYLSADSHPSISSCSTSHPQTSSTTSTSHPPTSDFEEEDPPETICLLDQPPEMIAWIKTREALLETKFKNSTRKFGSTNSIAATRPPLTCLFPGTTVSSNTATSVVATEDYSPRDGSGDLCALYHGYASLGLTTHAIASSNAATLNPGTESSMNPSSGNMFNAFDYSLGFMGEKEVIDLFDHYFDHGFPSGITEGGGVGGPVSGHSFNQTTNVSNHPVSTTNDGFIPQMTVPTPMSMTPATTPLSASLSNPNTTSSSSTMNNASLSTMSSNHSGGNRRGRQMRIKRDGLIKKTLSVSMDGQTYHLVCYYGKRDFMLGRSTTKFPQDLYAELCKVVLPPDLLMGQNFRKPCTLLPNPFETIDVNAPSNLPVNLSGTLGTAFPSATLANTFFRSRCPYVESGPKKLKLDTRKRSFSLSLQPNRLFKHEPEKLSYNTDKIQHDSHMNQPMSFDNKLTHFDNTVGHLNDGFIYQRPRANSMPKSQSLYPSDRLGLGSYTYCSGSFTDESGSGVKRESFVTINEPPSVHALFNGVFTRDSFAPRFINHFRIDSTGGNYGNKTVPRQANKLGQTLEGHQDNGTTSIAANLSVVVDATDPSSGTMNEMLKNNELAAADVPLNKINDTLSVVPRPDSGDTLADSVGQSVQERQELSVQESQIFLNDPELFDLVDHQHIKVACEDKIVEKSETDSLVIIDLGSFHEAFSPESSVLLSDSLDNASQPQPSTTGHSTSSNDSAHCFNDGIQDSLNLLKMITSDSPIPL